MTNSYKKCTHLRFASSVHITTSLTWRHAPTATLTAPDRNGSPVASAFRHTFCKCGGTTLPLAPAAYTSYTLYHWLSLQSCATGWNTNWHSSFSEKILNCLTLSNMATSCTTPTVWEVPKMGYRFSMILRQLFISYLQLHIQNCGHYWYAPRCVSNIIQISSNVIS